MTSSQTASLLVPYAENTQLPESLLNQISTYLDLLLRWNARTNLTSIRSPEEIITRHFGESLFAARQIFPAGNTTSSASLADIGSGAGFPGLPIKLWCPQIRLTLVEAQQKKSTFLREVIRALNLASADVQAVRAQELTQTFDVVTLRAVEHFNQILPVAAGCVNPGGRLALLIGRAQIPIAKALLPEQKWEDPLEIPNSAQSVLLLSAAFSEPI